MTNFHAPTIVILGAFSLVALLLIIVLIRFAMRQSASSATNLPKRRLIGIADITAIGSLIFAGASLLIEYRSAVEQDPQDDAFGEFLDIWKKTLPSLNEISVNEIDIASFNNTIEIDEPPPKPDSEPPLYPPPPPKTIEPVQVFTTLERVIDHHSIGKQWGEILRAIGPAGMVTAQGPGWYHIKINQCEVVVDVDQSRSVQRIASSVSMACNAVWREALLPFPQLGDQEQVTIKEYVDQLPEGKTIHLNGCFKPPCGATRERFLEIVIPAEQNADVENHQVNKVVRVRFDNADDLKKLDAFQWKLFYSRGTSKLLTAVCDRKIFNGLTQTIGDIKIEELEISRQKQVTICAK